MRTFFSVDRRDLIPFTVCALLYAAIVFGWNLSGIADSDMAFIRGTVPVIGDLPPQSISKLVVTSALYLLALVYALAVLAGGEYRRYLPQFVGFSIVSFLAWVALNYWVTAGFLNSPSTLLFGGVTVVLMALWSGGLMRLVSRLHDPMALFLVRFGLGLAAFVTIVQIVAVLTPDWRSPTQGIPLLYTLTLNALVGVFIAGVGSNMLWREKRAQMLAAASKRR